MILDAAKGFGQEPPRYDVCIVGAGPAGITVALELESSGWRVCLLEAGGTGYERSTQGLFEGEVLGQPYPALRETRVGALGGSTTVWAGWCRPLDPLDFEPRAWSGADGWPFGREELDPWYARAHELCGLAAFDYDPAHWAPALGPERMLPTDPTFVNQIFHVNIQDFGARYRERLARSRAIDLVLHAPVTRLHLEGPSCAAADVRTLRGHELTIRADRFVLAAGGIENPRLLLLSAEGPGGADAPGNSAGMVGRYFADHAYVDFGSLVLRQPAALGFYGLKPAEREGEAMVRGVLSVRAEAVTRERLLQSALFFHPRYEAHRAFATAEVKAWLQLWNKLNRRAVPGALWPFLRQAVRAPRQIAIATMRKLVIRDGPARCWRMRAAFETSFRPENRVTLGDDRDRLGRRRARVVWRIDDADVESMRRVTHRFDEAVQRAELGHLDRGFPDEPGAWRRMIEPGKHHMGATRMHRSPQLGVVDEHGRVHGLSNLFVTGSSVFPSGGYANPTLTIVALAARLGHHLKEMSAPRLG
jgi:choline dehydrogenase-like flavoprotein